MNSIIWNCRGAGNKLFPGLIRDCKRMYNIDFLAILVQRISGDKASSVIRRLGFDDSFRVDAVGFSGGIWCLWKTTEVSINVIHYSSSVIHLECKKANMHWIFSIVYASPQEHLRSSLWTELRDFSNSVSGPWCLGGDFNQALFAHEKRGGGAFNYVSSSRLLSCLNDCGLQDIGFKGPPFTWQRGELMVCLDRVVANSEWLLAFSQFSMINIPLPSSDHTALWLRLEVNRTVPRRYFKFLSPWLSHPDFSQQVRLSWQHSSNWTENMDRFTDNISAWNRDIFGNIFKNKRRILNRLDGIYRSLSSCYNPYLVELRQRIWDEYY
ncbi:hypothetical protein RIF29_33213 [Crotalaria pallida]|uniref:Endonuclease/exonuclease/phosphatase domain-containing protein n=1 Tax=Crotalaria pallida TaxID=3830 RepID=A0AAN9HSM4_CROPI